MKKWNMIPLVLALVLALTACGQHQEQPPAVGGQPQEQTPAVYDIGLVDRLAEGGAFSEELEPLEADVLWVLYRLEQAGLSREQLTEAAALRSSGASCEEAAVLAFDSEQSAQTAVQALKDYLTGQIQSNRDYRPAAIPTLEEGSVDQRGSTVLLLVVTDRDAAEKVIDGPTLAADGQPQEQTAAARLVDRLAESGAFSEELEPLEADVLWVLYRLEQAGLSREQLTEAAALRSSGATCEEAAVLVFDSEQSAQTAVQALKDYLAGQIQSNRDYRPAAIPTLEEGSVDQRGSTVLLLVATDRSAAEKVIDGK